MNNPGNHLDVMLDLLCRVPTLRQVRIVAPIECHSEVVVLSARWLSVVMGLHLIHGHHRRGIPSRIVLHACFRLQLCVGCSDSPHLLISSPRSALGPALLVSILVLLGALWDPHHNVWLLHLGQLFLKSGFKFILLGFVL